MNRKHYPNCIKEKIGSLTYKGKKLDVYEVWRLYHTRIRRPTDEEREINNLPNSYWECECGFNSLIGMSNVKMIEGRTYSCCFLELKEVE